MKAKEKEEEAEQAAVEEGTNFNHTDISVQFL